jgi:hypothetical protein
MPLFLSCLIGSDEFGWDHMAGKSASSPLSCHCSSPSSTGFHYMSLILSILLRWEHKVHKKCTHKCMGFHASIVTHCLSRYNRRIEDGIVNPETCRLFDGVINYVVFVWLLCVYFLCNFIIWDLWLYRMRLSFSYLYIFMLQKSICILL